MQKLLAFAAVVAVAAGGFWLLSDPGRVGLYDADLNRLAETPREARCSGFTFWETRGQGNKKQVAACIKTSTRNNEVDHSQVLREFCMGAVEAGFVGNINAECIPVLEGRQMWPTLSGTLSVAFNDRYPWPGEIFPATRTDDAPERGNEREGFVR